MPTKSSASDTDTPISKNRRGPHVRFVATPPPDADPNAKVRMIHRLWLDGVEVSMICREFTYRVHPDGYGELQLTLMTPNIDVDGEL